MIGSSRTLHGQLIQAAVTGPIDDEEAYLWMVLIHTHEIHTTLFQGSSGDAEVRVLSPLTQRDAADAIASLWGSNSQEQRSSPEHWYAVYNVKGPIEVIEEARPSERRRIEVLTERLLRVPGVIMVIPDTE